MCLLPTASRIIPAINNKSATMNDQNANYRYLINKIEQNRSDQIKN